MNRKMFVSKSPTKFDGVYIFLPFWGDESKLNGENCMKCASGHGNEPSRGSTSSQLKFNMAEMVVLCGKPIKKVWNTCRVVCYEFYDG